MAEQKDITCFEFGEEQNSALLRLSHTLRRLGRVVLVAGLLLVAYLVVSFLDPLPLLEISDTRNVVLEAADYALWLAIAFLVIYVSVRVIKLATPIRLITQTRGADIPYLMQFVADLTRLAATCFWTLLTICFLIVVSLVLLVLVF
jgi:hypothetical protein